MVNSTEVIPPAKKKLFLLMPVLPQTFLTLVGCHLVPFPFLPAGHKFEFKILFLNLYVAFHFTHESFSRFESRNIMGRNDDGGIF